MSAQMRLGVRERVGISMGIMDTGIMVILVRRGRRIRIGKRKGNDEEGEGGKIKIGRLRNGRRIRRIRGSRGNLGFG